MVICPIITPSISKEDFGMLSLRTWLIMSLLLLITTQSHAQSQNVFAQLLDQHQLDPHKVQLNARRWKGGGVGRLPIFDKVSDDWIQMQPTAMSLGDSAKESHHSFHQLTMMGWSQLQNGFLTIDGPGSESIEQSIQRIHSSANRPISDMQLAVLDGKIKKLSQPMRQAAEQLLWPMAQAISSVNKFSGTLPDGIAPEIRYELAANFASGFYPINANTQAMLKTFNEKEMIIGAHGITRVLSDFINKPITIKADDPSDFQWETPFGMIILGNKGSQNYPNKPILLAIDVSGDDVYHAPQLKHRQPVSVVIDLAGNDQYLSEDAGAFGVGICGYSFLYDKSGNDKHESKRMGAGSGSFGIGIVIDGTGDDSYTTMRFGQGAATYGIGVLSDVAGNDTYNCYQFAQGYGGPRGMGMLIDMTGNDKYLANDEDIKFPSAQSKKHNTSLVQGCGFGRRANQDVMAGGLGILVDGAGNDEYCCGVFGQGVAYWFALGMLIDFDGNDVYHGPWYVQGAAVHHAASAFLDLNGNDDYTSTISQNTGHAKDYSVGLFYDAKGNDHYNASGNSLGTAIWNGIGLFHDAAGNDVYELKNTPTPDKRSTNFGHAKDVSKGQWCAGLFIDDAGQDTFPDHNEIKPGVEWLLPLPENEQPGCVGIGSNVAR
jgi:hypothetical protein